MFEEVPSARILLRSIIKEGMKKLFGCILGHNPLLSMLEVLSVFKYNCSIIAFDKEFLIIEVEEGVSFMPDHLGGLVKIFEVKRQTKKEHLFTTMTQVVQEYCTECAISDKLVYTVSVYGAFKRYQKEALLHLKKTVKPFIQGKVRFINKSLEKNVAEPLLHSEHIYEKGVEVVVAMQHETYFVGVGMWAQDIDAYTFRDMKRPFRDSRNGMLPPKLAQTMLNLLSPEHRIVWDPFCGSGTVLMEGILQEKTMYGTDSNEVMVKHSFENTSWVAENFSIQSTWHVQVGDVKAMQTVPSVHGAPTALVTEGYLGKNYRGEYPTKDEVQKIQGEIMELWENFFHFLKYQKHITEIVAAFPIHILVNGVFLRCRDIGMIAEENGFSIDPLLGDLSVDRTLRASYTKEGTVLYVRGEQYVGRELIRFKRK